MTARVSTCTSIPTIPRNLRVDGAGAKLDVSAGLNGLVVSTATQQRVPISLRYEHGELVAETADGVRRRARVELATANAWRKAVSELPPPPAPEHSGCVEAPIAGHVIALLVSDGSHVTQGTPIVVLEAMKMQNTLLAPVAGLIRFEATAGQVVRTGDLLATISTSGSQP